MANNFVVRPPRHALSGHKSHNPIKSHELGMIFHHTHHSQQLVIQMELLSGTGAFYCATRVRFLATYACSSLRAYVVRSETLDTEMATFAPLLQCPR